MPGRGRFQISCGFFNGGSSLRSIRSTICIRPKLQLEKQEYCKNIKTRTFTAPSNIEFHKARINNDEAGYAILFDIEITSPKKVARKHSACVFLNKEGKITYVAHKPFKRQ